MKRGTALEIICLLIVLLFIYTAASKLIDHAIFVHELYNQPIPELVVPLLSWLLPVSEIAVSVSLVFPATRKAGLYGALILMMVFSIYTALILFHAFKNVPCSCGGVIKQFSWLQHFLFNILYTALAFIGIYLNKETNHHYKIIHGHGSGDTENLLKE